MPGCGATSMGKICPGNLAANATIPCAFCASYCVMKMELPPMARLNTPPKPPPPPNCVDVVITMVDVIQESSPDSANSASPGSSVISSTGIVVPRIFSCIGAPSVLSTCRSQSSPQRLPLRLKPADFYNAAVNWMLLLKSLHVLSAVVAIGSNVTYAVWSSRGSRDEAHLGFALRGVKFIDDRI